MYPRQHVGRRGADIAAGQPVLARGRRAEPEPHRRRSPPVGTTDVEVYARPRVAILSTGNEIVEPGQPLGPGQIYDINRFTLSSIVRAHGGVAVVGARCRTRFQISLTGASTPPRPRTSWFFPAAAPSASAI